MCFTVVVVVVAATAAYAVEMLLCGSVAPRALTAELTAPTLLLLCCCYCCCKWSIILTRLARMREMGGSRLLAGLSAPAKGDLNCCC